MPLEVTFSVVFLIEMSNKFKESLPEGQIETLPEAQRTQDIESKT